MIPAEHTLSYRQRLALRLSRANTNQRRDDFWIGALWFAALVIGPAGALGVFAVKLLRGVP